MIDERDLGEAVDGDADQVAHGLHDRCAARLTARTLEGDLVLLARIFQFGLGGGLFQPVGLLDLGVVVAEDAGDRDIVA
ncbi:hypothetical protein ACQP0C_32800 [Nocardia sp. CA-129566]|uniref:hypothetical protein n=1 Tax=Nocardia sp. CA-129566 TaxID=3239976 RepID=UPI003D97E0A2